MTIQAAADPIGSAIRRIAADPDAIRPLPSGAASLFVVDPAIASLCSPTDVGRWFADANLRYPQFTVIERGLTLPPEEVTLSRRVMGRAEGGFADGAAIAAAVRRGATVQIAELETWHPAVRALCAELAGQTRMRAGAVAFLTGPAEQGLRRHRDDAHIVAVQIAGTKRWELYEDAESECVASVLLEQGQGMSVPLGIFHRAFAGDHGSLHLSFTLRPLSVREAVQALCAAFVATLGAGDHLDGARDERLRRLDGLMSGLREWTASLDLAATLDGLEDRLLAGQREATTDPFNAVVERLGRSDATAGTIKVTP